ncbi:MAG TPA: ECF transporter S component [Eubacterium sp.]|nr:ECF transporter S component [Eubacterium sp.]
MKKETTYKITLCALFSALCFVFTYAIKLPFPVTSGYIHIGDTFVILSGIILGPVYAFVSSAIGASLADLLSGYAIYIPVTFVTKGLMSLAAHYCFKLLSKIVKSIQVKVVISGIFTTAICTLGYLIFEYFMYGNAAFANIIPNTIQGIMALVIAVILSPAIKRLKNESFT